MTPFEWKIVINNLRRISRYVDRLAKYLEDNVMSQKADNWNVVKGEIAQLKTANASLTTENASLRAQIAQLTPDAADQAADADIAAEADAVRTSAPQ